jgi:hypothetical protein
LPGNPPNETFCPATGLGVGKVNSKSISDHFSVQIEVLLLMALTVTGCSIISVSNHAVGAKPPLCSEQKASQRVLVFWGVAWREDQKEEMLREEIVSRAITRFFSSTQCFAAATIQRSIGSREALILTDAEILSVAQSFSNNPDKVIVIRVEELGPVVRLNLSPILWEGGTDIVLRVRVLDILSGSLESDLTTHGTKAGPFILRGTSYLENSLNLALQSVLLNTSLPETR